MLVHRIKLIRGTTLYAIKILNELKKKKKQFNSIARRIYTNICFNSTQIKSILELIIQNIIKLKLHGRALTNNSNQIKYNLISISKLNLKRAKL